MSDFSELVGQTISSIVVADDRETVTITTDRGVYRMSHSQDCCETVALEDVVGDLSDLIGLPILLAEEVEHSDETPEGAPTPEWQDDSFTWTFYKLATNRGRVTLRWFGTSNGYYSEGVDFYEVPQ